MDALYCQSCGKECTPADYRGEIGLCAICETRFDDFDYQNLNTI